MEKENIRNENVVGKINKLIVEELCLNRIPERHDTTVFGIRSAQRGITLITLVVTIIILLILSGIVLNLTLRRKWNNKNGRKSRKRLSKCKHI